MAEPSDTTAQKHPRRLHKSRMEAFSDGVFAFAMTLLVVDLAVPAVAGDELLAALADDWPKYLGYLVSFCSIGAIWLRHNAITEYLEHSDVILLRLNLFLLFSVAFLPFPTSILTEYLGENQAERVAATIYGVNLLLTAVATSLMWRYAVRAQLVRPDAADEEIQMLNQRLNPSLIGYAVMILLGLLLPLVAIAGYLAIALYLILPFGRLKYLRA